MKPCPVCNGEKKAIKHLALKHVIKRPCTHCNETGIDPVQKLIDGLIKSFGSLAISSHVFKAFGSEKARELVPEEK